MLVQYVNYCKNYNRCYWFLQKVLSSRGQNSQFALLLNIILDSVELCTSYFKRSGKLIQSFQVVWTG